MDKRKRPKITQGQTIRIETGCGHLYVTINRDDGNLPIEVFATLGKAGGCGNAQMEALTRMVTLCLKFSVPIEAILRQMDFIKCPSRSIDEGDEVQSCADGIALALRRSLGLPRPKVESKNRTVKPPLAENPVGQCPECGTSLVWQEGCFICPSCGYTKC